jgi:hypothetical protein
MVRGTLKTGRGFKATLKIGVALGHHKACTVVRCTEASNAADATPRFEKL